MNVKYKRSFHISVQSCNVLTVCGLYVQTVVVVLPLYLLHLRGLGIEDDSHCTTNSGV